MTELTGRDVMRLLQESVNLSSQKQVAVLIGVSPQFINDVLRGRRDPGDKVAGYFGLKRKVVFVEEAK